MVLWSIAQNNADHDHSQSFWNQASRWTRKHINEVDFDRLERQLTDSENSTDDASPASEIEKGHTAADGEPTPAERAASEVLDRIRPPERSLAELHGDQLHDELEGVLQNLILSLQLEDHPAFDHRNIGNVLFTGPPGTGKTTAAEGIAAELVNRGYDFQFLPIKGHHFKNHLLGASEGAVEEVFQQADAAGPTLIFIDEFEDIATRDSDRHEVTQAITGTLLSLLSGGQAVDQVALLGATNRPDQLDPALRGRFEDNIVEFTEPPAKVKHKILFDALEGPGVTVQVAQKRLAELTYAGLVGRDLEVAAREAIGRARSPGGEPPYHVTYDHIRQAVNKVRAQKGDSLASQ
jgi:transitional endoplasmic reticulum ATPase